MQNNEYKPYKPCMIQFSVSDPSQFDFIISQLDGLKFWAYIFHDSDIYDESDYPVKQGSAKVGDLKPKHLHVVCIDSPKNYKTWGNRFSIPDFMVEYVRNRKSALLYLTHESHLAVSQGKHKYDRKEIKTSDVIKFQEYITQGDVPDYDKEFSDLWQLYKGGMTIKQYLKNHPDLLACSSYQRVKVFQSLLNITNNFNRM